MKNLAPIERIFQQKNEDKAFLLYLLNYGKVKGPIRLIKLIYLSNHVAREHSLLLPFHYKFIRWHNGPYCRSISMDLESLIIVKLTRWGISDGIPEFSLTEHGLDLLSSFMPKLDSQKREAIDLMHSRYWTTSTKDIMSYLNSLTRLISVPLGSLLPEDGEDAQVKEVKGLCVMSVDWFVNNGNCPLLQWRDNLPICTSASAGIGGGCPEGETED